MLCGNKKKKKTPKEKTRGNLNNIHCPTSNITTCGSNYKHT